MIALTSRRETHATLHHAACMDSWMAAGLTPLLYASEARPTINEMLANITDPTILINADLELAMTPDDILRFVARSRSGLGYLRQYNYDTDKAKCRAEPAGLSAFVVHPRHAVMLAHSDVMRLGVPWWDYWLPMMALRAGESLYTPSHPTAYHMAHALGWSSEEWIAGGMEMARLLGVECAAHGDAVSALSTQVMGDIVRGTVLV